MTPLLRRVGSAALKLMPCSLIEDLHHGGVAFAPAHDNPSWIALPGSIFYSDHSVKSARAQRAEHGKLF